MQTGTILNPVVCKIPNSTLTLPKIATSTANLTLFDLHPQIQHC